MCVVDTHILFIGFNHRGGKQNASPWAVKKINTQCLSKQVSVYQQRLSEEAKVLKEINHPNIVGKAVFFEIVYSIILG